MSTTPTQIFTSEVLGTFLLILSGYGVTAGVVLPTSKAKDSGWIVVTTTRDLAVFAGVYAAYKIGAYLNSAAIIGLVIAGRPLAEGISATPVNILVYCVVQMVGTMAGAATIWLPYKKQFDQEVDAASKPGMFVTGPVVRPYGWSVMTEMMNTFALLTRILASGRTLLDLGPLAVAMVIVVVGIGLDGPTGYAISPICDLGPRIIHAPLPTPGKGGSDWTYSWVSVVSLLIGAIAAGLIVPHVAGLS